MKIYRCDRCKEEKDYYQLTSDINLPIKSFDKEHLGKIVFRNYEFCEDCLQDLEEVVDKFLYPPKIPTEKREK